MKKLTVLIVFASMSILLWSQSEKLNWKEKSELFGYFEDWKSADYSDLEIWSDTFAIHYLELVLQRGGTYCFQRGGNFPEKKYKHERESDFNMIEFQKKLHERKEIPFELIKKYHVYFDLCILEHKVYFDYELKVKSFEDIEILRKSFT